MGGGRPRDGAGHQVVSGATGDPAGAQRIASGRAAVEEYVGPWLPEPLLLDDRDASTDVVLAESVSMAMLVLLETLNPDERAVFVLREVFGFDYDEIAGAVGKSVANVRQVAHRAREHVQARRKRFEPADSAMTAELTDQFMTAASTGDVDGLMALLAPDATWTADSGGKATAAPQAGDRRAEGGGHSRRALPRGGGAHARRPVRDGGLQQLTGDGRVQRRPAGGRLPHRDHRRQDHPLLCDAQPGQVVGDCDPKRDRPRRLTS